MADKPVGTYQCAACESIWDGSQLYQDERATGTRWTCGYLICGGIVREISDKPKGDK